MASIPPTLILIVTAVIVALSPARLSRVIAIAGVIITAAAMSYYPAGLAVTMGFMKYTVALVVNDPARLAAAWSILLGAGLAAALAPVIHQDTRRSMTAGLLTVAFGIGVVLSGDLIAIFLQWELLTLSITALIFMAGTEQARAAGIRFLLLQLIGGFLFKYGMHGHYETVGSYVLSSATPSVATMPGGWALIAGACIKLGAWPVAMVLPDAARSIDRSASLWLGLSLPVSALFVLFTLAQPMSEGFAVLGFVMIAYALVYGVVARSGFVRIARVGVGLSGLVLVFGATASEGLAELVLWALPSFYVIGFFIAAQVALYGTRDPMDTRAEVLADTDWVWKSGLFSVARAAANLGFSLRDVIAQTGLGMAGAVQRVARRFLGSGALMARTWGIGYTAIWVIGLLALYGVVYLAL